MLRTDLKKWAREELIEAVDARAVELLESLDADADSDEVVVRERNRVARFLGFEERTRNGLVKGREGR